MALPEIKVKIGADTSDLDKGLAAATKNLGKFAAAAGVGIAGAAIAAATGLAVLTKRAIDNADELGKASQKMGMTVEALSRLQYAAKLSGVELGGLQTGMNALARNMASNSDAFGQLGVSITNSDGTLRSSVAVLGDVADRFAGMEDGATKTALALSIFGRAGADMIPMLNAGSAGLAAMAQESDNVGNTIDGKTAKAAERFNDTLSKIEATMGGVVNKVMVAVLPALQDLADIIASPAFATALQDFATSVINAMNDIAPYVFNAINNMRMLRDLFSEANQRSTEGIKGTITDLKNQATEISNRVLENRQRLTSGNWLDEFNRTSLEEQIEKDMAAVQPLIDKIAELNRVIAERNKPFVPTEDGETETYTPPNLPTLTGGGDGTSELDAERERIAARLAVIQEGFLTEAEMRDAKYAADRAALQSAFALGLSDEEQYRKDVEALEKQHQDQLAAIRNAALYQNLDATASIFGSISSIMKTQGDKQIALQKGIASAGVAISTAAGIMKAIEQFGWPGGLLPAAAVAAQGMAQLASINSASASGANSAGVKGSSNASTAEPAMNRTLTVQGITAGQIFTGDSMRDFMEQMLQMQRDGYQVVLA
jgi:hypothetical protein